MEFVPELLLRSEEEYRFYMELKRRTGKALKGYAFGEKDYTATLCHKKIADSTTEISDQEWGDNSIFCGLGFEIVDKQVVFEDG